MIGLSDAVEVLTFTASLAISRTFAFETDTSYCAPLPFRVWPAPGATSAMLSSLAFLITDSVDTLSFNCFTFTASVSAVPAFTL